MIEEAVRMWELFREGLVGELNNIPEERWEWKPAEGARSVREVALHVVGAGKGFADELLADETQFMRLRDPKVQQALIDSFGDVRTKDDVVRLIQTVGAESFARLREHAPRLESATMQSTSGPQSRLSGIFFAASHEMYHRGQVTAYARGMGLVPAMTQPIVAATKAATKK